MNLLSPRAYSRLMQLFYDRRLRDRIARLLNPQTGQRLLDVACGSGDLFAVTHPCRYIGTDVDFGRVRHAAHNRMTLVVSNARALPFLDHSFDRILASGLFHHVNDETAVAVLAEMARIIKPNGRVVVLDAIWPRRWYNLTGLLARRLDDGKFVRHPRDYELFFSKAFAVHNLEYPSRLTLDYVLAVLESPGDA